MNVGIDAVRALTSEVARVSNKITKAPREERKVLRFHYLDIQVHQVLFLHRRIKISRLDISGAG